MNATPLAGTCRVLYCLDVARQLDLGEVDRALSSSKRATFRHKGRIPAGGGLSPSVRLDWIAPASRVGAWNVREDPELSIYEQGALCVTWSIPFDDPLESLVLLSALLYANDELQARSRAVAGQVLESLGLPGERATAPSPIEDYVCFQVSGAAGSLSGRAGAGAAGWGGGAGTPAWTGPTGPLRTVLARVLRAEEDELSSQEIDDALGAWVAYRPDEACYVDWLGAFLLGADTEDERLVLELATIELLELRLLDAQLDAEIEESYRTLTRSGGPLRALLVQRRELQRIGRMQADDALLHEGADNPLKLFGDDYLARLYRTAAARFHFDDWDASIERKLAMLRNVHQSLADTAAHRRAEVLEWIIILLIAADIALYFTPLR